MRFGCQAQWSAAHPADDRSERGALRPIKDISAQKFIFSIVRFFAVDRLLRNANFSNFFFEK